MLDTSLSTFRVSDLTGKRGLVVGIANASSIAYGCAKAYRDLGAELAVTYLNPKSERFVRPLAEELGAPIVIRFPPRGFGRSGLPKKCLRNRLKDDTDPLSSPHHRHVRQDL